MSLKTEQLKKGLRLSEENADEWDERGEGMWKQGPRAEIFDFFLRSVGDARGRVLDLGCGPGASTLRMKEHGFDAVGVDLSPKMVEAAKRRGVEAYVSDGDPLPFADATFDSAFCCTCLEWTPEPAKLFEEMLRVVKPGGRIVVAVLGACVKPRNEGYGRLFGMPVAQNMMMPWELHRMLEEYGLTVEAMHGAYPPNVPRELAEQLPTWAMQSSIAFIWAFAALKNRA